MHQETDLPVTPAIFRFKKRYCALVWCRYWMADRFIRIHHLVLLAINLFSEFEFPGYGRCLKFPYPPSESRLTTTTNFIAFFWSRRNERPAAIMRIMLLFTTIWNSRAFHWGTRSSLRNEMVQRNSRDNISPVYVVTFNLKARLITRQFSLT